MLSAQYFWRNLVLHPGDETQTLLCIYWQNSTFTGRAAHLLAEEHIYWQNNTSTGRTAHLLAEQHIYWQNSTFTGRTAHLLAEQHIYYAFKNSKKHNKSPLQNVNLFYVDRLIDWDDKESRHTIILGKCVSLWTHRHVTHLILFCLYWYKLRNPSCCISVSEPSSTFILMASSGSLEDVTHLTRWDWYSCQFNRTALQNSPQHYKRPVSWQEVHTVESFLRSQ